MVDIENELKFAGELEATLIPADLPDLTMAEGSLWIAPKAQVELQPAGPASADPSRKAMIFYVDEDTRKNFKAWCKSAEVTMGETLAKAMTGIANGTITV